MRPVRIDCMGTLQRENNESPVSATPSTAWKEERQRMGKPGFYRMRQRTSPRNGVEKDPMVMALHGATIVAMDGCPR